MFLYAFWGLQPLVNRVVKRGRELGESMEMTCSKCFSQLRIKPGINRFGGLCVMKSHNFKLTAGEVFRIKPAKNLIYNEGALSAVENQAQKSACE